MNRSTESDRGQCRPSDSTTVSEIRVTGYGEEENVPDSAILSRSATQSIALTTRRRYRAPMTTSAHVVSADLHQRRAGLGSSRLNSLLYLCQGHHLGDLGEPLFAEPIFAVAGGAVVEDFNTDAGETESLAGEQLNTVAYVVARYGNLSAGDLRTLIRAADPWKLAAARPENPRIEWIWMQDWFERAAAAFEPDEPRLTRQQLTELAEKALATPPGPGVADTRESIQARIDAARRRASGA